MSDRPAAARIPLFRPEAVEHALQGGALGPVLVSTPPAARWFALLAVALLAAVLLGGTSIELPRLQNLAGHVATEAGLIAAVAPVDGTVQEVAVSLDQAVKAGDILVRIAQAGTGDAAAGAGREAAHRLQEQLALLERELRSLDARQRLDRERIEVELSQARRRLDVLTRQMVVIRREIDTWTAQQRRYERLSGQGLLAAAQREAAQVSQAQASSRALEVEDEIAGLIGRIAALQVEQRAQPVQAEAERAAKLKEHARLAGELAGLLSERIASLRAPAAGRVTVISLAVGQAVKAGEPLVSLLPADSRLLVEFPVLPSEVGLIRPGQKVLLKYDAFPFQQYGTHDGTVEAVSRTPVNSALAALRLDAAAGRFLVRAAIERDRIPVGGRELPLLPGMSVQGAIVVEQRTVFEWLFEPLLRLRGRL
jgi:membrane fusion protein